MVEGDARRLHQVLENLVDGVTVQEKVDNVTGLSRREVVESKARPKTMNSVSTKPKYCSMSGAAVIVFGAQLWMNADIDGITRK